VDEAVHELHATEKGEALYVVGPEHAYVIEANANDAAVEEIDDIYVRTNYAVQLWESAAPERYLYAPHFETRFDGWAAQGEVVKLGVDCAYGILIEDVGSDRVRIRAVHEDHESIDLNVGEVKTLSGFRVGLKEIDHHLIPQAHITLCYHYLEWKERMEDIVMGEHGNITERHLMNWSRLQRDDLGGLRPMCEASSHNHEAVAIYKIPDAYPGTMSSFWFTSYSRSSIYVPVHLCVRDIHEPYRTGEACRLSKSVFELRGNDGDTIPFEMAESVFIDENNYIEAMAFELLKKEQPEMVPALLTSSDMMMQGHALLTLELHLRLGEIEEDGNGSLGNAIERIWRNDYIQSFEGLKEALSFIVQYSDTTGEGSASQEVLTNMTELLIAIADTAAEHAIQEAECIPGGDREGVKEALKQYNKGKKNVEDGHFIEGMKKFEKSFRIARCVLNHEDYSHFIEESDDMSDVALYTILACVILLGVVMAYLKKRSRGDEEWRDD
ncbi:MAG: hypothetical protein KAU14_06920, partial [Thermoplasmata archaeon]|nr:hypothetical protein [Thermoplasmata archaeon]